MDPCRKFQEVAPTDRGGTTKNLWSRCWGWKKHTCDRHRPFSNHPHSWRAGRSWRVL